MRVGAGVVVDVGDDLAAWPLPARCCARCSRPRFAVRISRTSILGGDRRASRRSSRRRRRSPRSPGSRGAQALAAVSRSCARRCSVQTTTEMRGQLALGRERHVGERAARPPRAPASGARSRSVRPKSQSSMSWPPRCHSSVQAKTNAPAQPAANAVRTCQSSARACAVVAVAAAVEPDLRHEQRPVAGEVLQAGEIGLEPLARLEIDVEADEVEERQLEVLGRRDS